MTIKKYISHSGVILESGDFYGSGNEEVISTLEEMNKHLRVTTNRDIYDIPLLAGDYLSLPDGSGKIIKHGE